MRVPLFRLAAAASVIVALGGSAARADVYGLTAGLHRRGMAHFDSAGRFVQMVPAGIESTEGITVTPDGWVYVNGNGLGMGQLARARVGGPFTWQTVTPLGGPYQVPMGLAADPAGRIYATSNALFSEQGLTGALRYDPATGRFDPVVDLPDPTPPFGNLVLSVAPSPAGDVYLLRGGIGVERYNAAGEFVSLVVPAAAIGGRSEDIAFGPDGRLYVPTPGGVDRYDPVTGALVDHFIVNGSGGLDGALDLDFGGDGLLYVNSPQGSRVNRYDAVTGAFRDVFITPEQYGLVPEGGLRQIVYVVPEPGGMGVGVGGVALMLGRRRRRAA